jgi:NADPH:quinone reductase-like Zn-dependent oxidoreductase
MSWNGFVSEEQDIRAASTLCCGRTNRLTSGKLGDGSRSQWFVTDLAALFQLLAAGRIHPIVARRFPWRDARTANELLESGTVQGKVVLTAG